MPATLPAAAHVTTVCTGHDDWPARPPVDVPAGHATHAFACVVALDPPAEYVPEGQGFDMPEAWPATHQWPAGHGACVVPTIAAAQKKPAEQGVALLEVLPSARQKPAEHAAQAEAPGPEKVPAPHNEGATDAAGQAEPAGQLTDDEAVAQKKEAGHGFPVADALPTAVQKPAVQGTHDDAAVNAAPPDENVPAAQGFAVAEAVPTGQK